MAKGNTFKRVVVAIITIPAILALCYFGNIPFLIFILGIGLISFYEYSKFTMKKGNSPQLIIGSFAVMSIILNSYYSFVDFYDLMISFVILLAMVELFRNKGSAIYNMGATLLGVLYIGLFASSILSVREYFFEYTHGAYLIISILITIWVCDSAAYFGGLSLGKHKLFPRVSPNKSWEGALFGFVFSIIAMLILKPIILDFLSWSDVILIGLIVGTIGQLGDLIESLLKRDAGVKDSSNIIPGHGGIFDRFDSLLFAAPAVYIYLKYFVESF